mmetsp:Transcript_7462/g.11155  ORF Transcript_7462/g.11155 Transcript_7462/m.11155 type:complete len:498 (+) Transcript_7462:43-1536(+)
MNDPNGGYGQNFMGSYGIGGGENARGMMGLSSPNNLLPGIMGGISRQGSTGPSSPPFGNQVGSTMYSQSSLNMGHSLNRTNSQHQYHNPEFISSFMAQGNSNLTAPGNMQQRFDTIQGNLELENMIGHGMQAQRERSVQGSGGNLKLYMNEFSNIHGSSGQYNSGGIDPDGGSYAHQYRQNDYRISDHSVNSINNSANLNLGSVHGHQSLGFAMQSEDFPALGNHSSHGSSSLRAIAGGGYMGHQPSQQQSHSSLVRSQQSSTMGSKNSIIQQPYGNQMQTHQQNVSQVSQITLQNQQRLLQNSAQKQGQPTNRNEDEKKDYSLTGLLKVIRMTDPDLNMLALGRDLTTLGLNLDSSEVLYATFAGPWAESPCEGEPQFQLPQCYYMQPPALKTTHFSKFALETLFYIFYAMPQDVLQAYAAQELYHREWKFHSDLKLWMKRAPSTDPVAQQFIFFDHNAWERKAFTGALPISVAMSGGLSIGLMPEEDVRVKLSGS